MNALVVITACTAFVTAATTLFATLRNYKRIQEVHVLVNSRMTDVLARVDQLTLALEVEGKDVPVDPNPQ
jgi:hypothetical protein